MSVLEKAADESAVDAPTALLGPVTTIAPPSRLPKLDVRELWRYRELATTLVWRDIKIRYKQTFIGVVWAVLQPLVTTGIFTVIFGRWANFFSDGLDYPVFVFAGVLVWTYFQASLGGASASVAINRPLVTKVYFPRLLLPLGAVMTPIVDFLIALPILVGMMFYFDLPFSPRALLFPLFVLLAAIAAFATGLLFTVASVRYRDVPYAIPFLIQIWMFASPVFWSVNDPDLQEKYQWLASLNPMTGAITGFRWAVAGSEPPSVPVVAVGTVVAVLLFVFGLAVFRRAEPRFADTI